MIVKMNYFERAKFFKTKKRLGQNFLINPDVIDAIIEKAEISPDDTVIEIGPGVGFVTEQLVKHAKKVIAIELDEEAIKELEKLNAPNLEIIHRDILKTDFSELTNEKVKIVANIPYYITSPIIAHLLGEVDDLNNKNRSFAQSLVLYGQDIIAQYYLAMEIARLLNCQKDGEYNCDCLNCSWIRNNQHPAVLTITKNDNKPSDDTSSKVISIKQTLMINNSLVNSSDYYRVFIFCDSELTEPVEFERKHLKEFEDLKTLAKKIGFKNYQIGPLVRSSYNAAELHS